MLDLLNFFFVQLCKSRMWGFTLEFDILFAKIGTRRNHVKAFGFNITIIIIFVKGINDITFNCV